MAKTTNSSHQRLVDSVFKAIPRDGFEFRYHSWLVQRIARGHKARLQSKSSLKTSSQHTPWKPLQCHPRVNCVTHDSPAKPDSMVLTRYQRTQVQAALGTHSCATAPRLGHQYPNPTIETKTRNWSYPLVERYRGTRRRRDGMMIVPLTCPPSTTAGRSIALRGPIPTQGVEHE